jgi:hypothetical protein
MGDRDEFHRPFPIGLAMQVSDAVFRNDVTHIARFSVTPADRTNWERCGKPRLPWRLTAESGCSFHFEP